MLAATVTGAVGNDSFTESMTTPATSLSNVGSYPIVPTVSSPQLANYTVHAVNGTLTVTAVASSIALTAPANAALGTSVTLTATVGSPAGAPTGAVNFYLGSTMLGAGPLTAGGVATFNTSSLPAGSDVITATYSGTGNMAGSTSPAVTLVVTAAPINAPGSYTFVASPSTLSLSGIAVAKTMLTFTPAGAYSGTVTLSCANLPANVTCQFAQSQIAMSGNNQPVSVALLLSAAGPQARLAEPQTTVPATLLALTFGWPGSLAGLAWFAKRRKPAKGRRSLALLALIVAVSGMLAALSGCGAHGTFTESKTTSNVMVVATSTSGTTQNIILTVNVTE